MKDDEKKKPLSWEAADPKPPVIQSGHLESRTVNSADSMVSLRDDLQ